MPPKSAGPDAGRRASCPILSIHGGPGGPGGQRAISARQQIEAEDRQASASCTNCRRLLERIEALEGRLRAAQISATSSDLVGASAAEEAQPSNLQGDEDALLGPFSLASVDFGSVGFVAHNIGDSSGGMYQVDLSSTPLCGLRGIPDLEEFGRLSPTSPVTLSHEDRRVDRIPLQAQCFAFAYPLSGVADSSHADELNMSESHLSLLAMGGFVYMDSSQNVCGVNSLCQGNQIHLRGPTPFGRHALRNMLIQHGRIQDATIAALSDIGMKGFVWLSPGERFEGFEQCDGSAWPHGAFVYIYDSEEFDCFFSITESPDAVIDPFSTAEAPPVCEVVPF